MAIFQFFMPPEKLIEVLEVNFFLMPTRKKLWYVSTTSENFIKIWKIFYYMKFYDAFAKLESENFHNFINKKLVVSIFVTNRFERY